MVEKIQDFRQIAASLQPASVKAALSGVVASNSQRGVGGGGGSGGVGGVGGSSYQQHQSLALSTAAARKREIGDCYIWGSWAADAEVGCCVDSVCCGVILFGYVCLVGASGHACLLCQTVACCNSLSAYQQPHCRELYRVCLSLCVIAVNIPTPFSRQRCCTTPTATPTSRLQQGVGDAADGLLQCCGLPAMVANTHALDIIQVRL